MAGMLWTILQVTAWIILAVLFLVLLLLALVLFLPIFYKGRIVYRKDLYVELKASYFFHIFRFHLCFDKKLDYSLKALHLKLFSSEEEEELPSETEEEREQKPEQPPPEEDSLLQEDAVERQEAEQELERLQKKLQALEDRERKKGFSFSAFWKRQKRRLHRWIRRILHKWKGFKLRKEKLQATWQDKSHRRALVLIWVYTKKLLRHILPRKMRGTVRLGLEDPAATGQLLGYLAIFYPYYAGQLELIPSFEESIVEADLAIKGRIGIYYLIYIVLVLYMDKDVKRLYRFYKEKKLW